MILSEYSIVLIWVIFLASHQRTVGLTCYQCLACNTTDGNTEITTVSDGFRYSCYKMVGFALGIPVINRGVNLYCNAGNINSNGITAMNYCCTSDRCNTGLSLSNSFGLIILTVAVSIVFRASIIG